MTVRPSGGGATEILSGDRPVPFCGASLPCAFAEGNATHGHGSSSFTSAHACKDTLLRLQSIIGLSSLSRRLPSCMTHSPTSSGMIWVSLSSTLFEADPRPLGASCEVLQPICYEADGFPLSLSLVVAIVFLSFSFEMETKVRCEVEGRQLSGVFTQSEGLRVKENNIDSVFCFLVRQFQLSDMPDRTTNLDNKEGAFPSTKVQQKNKMKNDDDRIIIRRHDSEKKQQQPNLDIRSNFFDKMTRSGRCGGDWVLFQSTRSCLLPLLPEDKHGLNETTPSRIKGRSRGNEGVRPWA